jgi:hypothetical protein
MLLQFNKPTYQAIEINGNDHYVLNTSVFSSRVGVAVHGAADYIMGTHGKAMAAQPHLCNPDES